MSTGTLRHVVDRLKSFLRTHGAHDSDCELLRRFAQERDESAFAALVDRHGPLVFGVCRRILHHQHDAEDAFQATFVILARKAGTTRWEGSIRNWLHGVALRVARQARARAARRHETPAPATLATEAVDLSWREVGGILDDELAALPDAYRNVLLLCCLEGKTRDEAAETLGLSVGQVKGLLERGRDLLRKRLAKRGVPLPAVLFAGLTLNRRTPPPLWSTSAVRVGVTAAQGQTAGISPAVLLLAQPGTSSLTLKLVAGVTAGLVLLCITIGAVTHQPVASAPVAVPLEQPANEGEPAMKQATLIAGIVLGLTVSVAQADGERDKPRERQTTFRALVTAIDPAKGTISLFRRDDDYPDGKKDDLALAKDVKVEMDERASTIANVLIYTEVTVGLSADNKTVEMIRISLSAPTNGTIKAVNAEKGTLTIAFVRSERDRDVVEKTLTVAKEARIMLGRQALALADLKANDRVQLQTTPDRKTIQTLKVFRADGERGDPVERPRDPVRGGETIKAIDPTKGTITFTKRTERGAMDTTLKFADNLKVYLGEKEGKRADLQVGDTATYKTGEARDTVIEIRLAPKREGEK